MHQHQMEKLDATRPDATFGDNNINFDLQLKKFGVNVAHHTKKITLPVMHLTVPVWVSVLVM
jgi:hypothetical protein